MAMWRRQLNAQIADPELRARCVPDYVLGCKRVAFSNDWYPALARPNVELVTDPIERIEPAGVLAGNGEFRAADVMVFGTGFKSLEFLAPMAVTGLDGRRLEDAWRDGAQAYLGISVSGFPNFFVLYGPNTNLGGNSIIYMLEGQIGYTLAAIKALAAERLAWLDVRPDVQDKFNSWVQKASRKSGLGERLPQLVHDRDRAEHQQLARLHLHVPVPDPPVRPGRLPSHAQPGGRRWCRAHRDRHRCAAPTAGSGGGHALGRPATGPALPGREAGLAGAADQAGSADRDGAAAARHDRR